MTGETDLAKLIKGMKPERQPGEYVFCLINTLEQAVELNPLCTFQESEGTTIILPKHIADDNVLFYSAICAWITLTVHSSLEAVGLTAAVSKALTEANISCNVVAAYHHDHLFVPVKDADRAMDVLLSLSKN
jgi:uncharacterized protein